MPQLDKLVYYSEFISFVLNWVIFLFSVYIMVILIFRNIFVSKNYIFNIKLDVLGRKNTSLVGAFNMYPIIYFVYELM